MKRGAPEHPKTRRLARRLGIGVAQALGHLELLTHWTAKYAPAGDIGRHEDLDIEEGLIWEGEAGALVAALTEERWLDRSETHRLIVHDWPEHADDAVHAALARAGKFFADGSEPKMTRLSRDEREKCAEKFRAAHDERRHEPPSEADAPLEAHAERTPSARRASHRLPAPPPPAPPRQSPTPPLAPDGGGPRGRPLGVGPNEAELPYVEAWQARMQAPPDLLTLRRALDTLKAAGHGSAKIVAHLRRYVDPLVNPDGRYLTLPRFVETFATWDPDAKPPGRGRASPPASIYEDLTPKREAAGA